jgi:probable rRNA maturation factor
VNRVEINNTYLSSPELGKDLPQKCRKILQALDKNDWEISLLLTDDKTIRQLNKEYRNIDRATDVLSFSQLEGSPFPDKKKGNPLIAGDIVISIDTLKQNSLRWKVPLKQELLRVLVHGILHLSGMDHNEDDPDDAMLSLQEKILDQIGKE